MDNLTDLLCGWERNLKILHGLRAASVKQYMSKVKDFFAWHHKIGVVPDVMLTTSKDIEQYIEACFYRGNSNHTRKTKLVALNRFFGYLEYEKIIAQNPTRDIPSPKVRRKLIQIFTKDELLRIFSVIPFNEKGLRDTCIISLGIFGGLRINEIVSLTLGDIVDEGETFRLNIVDSKSDSRIVDIWRTPAEIIRQYVLVRISQSDTADAPLFVPYRKGGKRRTHQNGIYAGAAEKILKHYAVKAGIRRPRVHMHMLRASHASYLRYIEGYDIFAIAHRLGHKNISTTERYISVWSRIKKTEMYPSESAYWREFTAMMKDKMTPEVNSENRHGD